MFSFVKKQERGATAVLAMVLCSVLVGAAGIGIDSSNLAASRSNVQRSADASALSIAQDCAKGLATCSTTGGTATANYYVAQNSGSGSPAVSFSGRDVTVSVTKSVGTKFMGVVGTSTKNVAASATARDLGYPISGAPVLPIAVPYCTWEDNQAPATTPLLIRTDTLASIASAIDQLGFLSSLTSNLLNILDKLVGSHDAMMDDCDTQPLTVGGDVTVLKGPIWLSSLKDTVNSVLNWNQSTCEMDVHSELTDLVAEIGSSLAPPAGCIAKIGTEVREGDIILMPVYRPSSSTSLLGIKFTQVCSGLLTLVCDINDPLKLSIDIMGFAPFKVTGWNFSGKVNLDPNAPNCSQQGLVFSAVGSLLNIVTELLKLLTLSTMQIGCQGLQGYFVKSFTYDPDFTYSTSGADFGNRAVRLVE